MGRLTERDKDGEVYYPHCFKTKGCEGKGTSGSCDICAFNNKICEKLASYEDIIDEPEKLKLIDKWYSELCRENGQLKKELAEHKRLEEKRLLELEELKTPPDNIRYPFIWRQAVEQAIDIIYQGRREQDGEN